MAKKGKEPPGKEPEDGKEPKAGKVKKVRRKGALMDRLTNLVAVLFAVSLVAERLVTG